MIICEAKNCIYCKKSKCILEVVSISRLGICDNYNIYNFSDESIKKYQIEELGKSLYKNETAQPQKRRTVMYKNEDKL